MSDAATLPSCVPYVLRDGDGLSHLVAGQVIRTLAGVEQTAGGFGAVVCDCPLDGGPIPMHWHEREHDTWFVSRGRLQVWADDQSRVLAPGDFAYVPPTVTHSYRSVAPRTRFFGIIAPGGWEQFFVDAGEVWGMTGLPPSGRPFDFARIGPAMGKHRIMRVENPVFAEASPIGAVDQQLPDGKAPYFLEAGYGMRHCQSGHLSTVLLPRGLNDDNVDMRTIEGGRGSTTPTLRHADTHIFLHVIDGQVALTLDGEEHVLSSGDSANIPAGTAYATNILSGIARWVLVSSGGNGAELWDSGDETPEFSYALDCDLHAHTERLRGLSGVDVTIS